MSITTLGIPAGKRILIDEYRELTALKAYPEYRGPRRGPIRTPYYMDMKYIGPVLNQVPAVKMYEVIILQDYPTVVYSPRVLLTKDNYTMDFYDIAAEQGVIIPEVYGATLVNGSMATLSVKAEPVQEPVVETPVQEPVVTEPEVPVQEPAVTEPEAPVQEPVVETPATEENTQKNGKSNRGK